MIDPLGLLQDLVDAVVEDRAIDYEKTAKLQALAIAQAGQEFVADAITRQEEADERIAGH